MRMCGGHCSPSACALAYGLGLAVWLAAGGGPLAAEPVATAASAVERELAAQALVLRARGPAIGIRGVLRFALEAAAVGWNPADVAAALATAREMQELRPDHPDRGNFRWRLGNPEVSDKNAVAFALQQAAVLRLAHAERLAPTARRLLDEIIADALPALAAYAVKPAYTNIFLMKTANLLVLGPHVGGDHEAVGLAAWREWLAFTRQGGIREYASPTYAGVDLDSLALIASRAGDAAVRHEAEQVLEFVWTAIAAQFFAPAERLSGPHSRDYDYLFGRGYLDEHLAEAGWIAAAPRIEGAGWLPNARPAALRAFRSACRWIPPAGLRERFATPRFVMERIGPAAWQRTTNWIGTEVAAGIAGRAYSGEDKLLAIHLPGGPGVANIAVVFDGRGDPYGTRREPVGYDRHLKALHLVPFLAASQRGPRITAIYAWTPPPDDAGADLTRLAAHVLIPADAAVTTLSGTVPVGGSIPLGTAIFIARGDAVVGLRPLVPDTGELAPGALTLVRDPDQPFARRLTLVFAETQPSARAVLGLDVEVCDGVDDAGGSDFRRAFADRSVALEVAGEVATLSGSLPLEADLRRRVPLRCEPLLPRGALLVVDGVEAGRIPEPPATAAATPGGSAP